MIDRFLPSSLLAIFLSTCAPVQAQEAGPSPSEPRPAATERQENACAESETREGLLARGHCFTELDPPRWDLAIPAYERARALGSAEAANRLGYMKENGQAGPRDFAAAMALYREAADKGHSHAIANIGDLYEYGRGVPKDHAEARRWYERALAQNSPSAMHAIGMQYDHGRGVKQDWEEALRWYRRAAEQDLGASFSNIGFAYRYGRGVPVDLDQARIWFEKAVARGDANGMVNLGDLYIDGAGVPADFAKGLALVRRAADRKQPYALNNLGFFMLKGQGVPKEPQKAIALFHRAIEDEVPEAFVNLGMALNTGSGVERNQAEANRMFLKGAALGQPDGGYLYAINQYRGDGVAETDDEDEDTFERRTKEEARRWFGEAVKAGSTHAVLWLAWMQLKGEGGPANPGLAATTLELSGPRGKERLVLAALLKDGFGALRRDEARARALFETAASAGETAYDLKEPWEDHPPFMRAEDGRFDLAAMLERGRGGPTSIPEARRLYEEAAEAGDPRATVRMAKVLLDGGLGGKPDPARARALLDPSALVLHDSPNHALSFANLFDAGLGGPKDPKIAAFLLLKTVPMWQLPLRTGPGRQTVLAAIRRASAETRAAMRDAIRTHVEQGLPTPPSYGPLKQALGMTEAKKKHSRTRPTRRRP